MSTEFKQEEGYIVFKLGDLHRYCPDFNISSIERVWQIIAEGRALEGKRPFSAVVIENDLPENEPTWKAIEARVTGAQPAPSALAEAIIADMQAQHDSELITENDSGEALIRLDGAIAAVEDNFALAQPTPSIPEGWLRAIDEALVVAHVGVANKSDTYEQAKEKLNNLIGFHVDVATDPAVNGGYKLVSVRMRPKTKGAGE